MKKRKKDKIFLKFFIIFILGMIGSIAMLGFFIYQYKNNQYSYQDLELKRYTFLAYERKRVAYSNKGNSFVDYIYVKEEEKPLTIVDTVRDAYQMKDFDAIRYEDIIYCYVTAHKALDASYDVIEIKANENVILSLKEYNQEISENGLAGIIVFSIGILACLGMSIYFFVLYKKDE